MMAILRNPSSVTYACSLPLGYSAIIMIVTIQVLKQQRYGSDALCVRPSCLELLNEDSGLSSGIIGYNQMEPLHSKPIVMRHRWWRLDSNQLGTSL